jgi:threonine synthase
MKFFNSKNPKDRASFVQAVWQGLAPQGGLWLPVETPPLPPQWRQWRQLSLPELAENWLAPYLEEEVEAKERHALFEESFNFPLVLRPMTEQTALLELFHGPTCAFKDVAARFLARLMQRLSRQVDRPIRVLVATSGDTGGAVASGFSGVEGIEVWIFFPIHGVSPLQKKQLTTWGANVRSIGIEGSFDDCQALVKGLLADPDCGKAFSLTTANSINIARLLPQSLYYLWAVLHWPLTSPLVVSVPSGNFGNVTAGLLAKRRGLPLEFLIAATNANDGFIHFQQQGVFPQKEVKRTCSNAMDVAKPSNFERLLAMDASKEAMAKDLRGVSVTDEETLQAMNEVCQHYGVLLDPHTAVGWVALHRLLQPYQRGLVLATAHPAKFRELWDQHFQKDVPLPASLADLQHKPERFECLAPDFDQIKECFLS